MHPLWPILKSAGIWTRLKKHVASRSFSFAKVLQALALEVPSPSSELQGSEQNFPCNHSCFSPWARSARRNWKQRTCVFCALSALPAENQWCDSELPCSDVAEGGLSGLSSTGSWTGCGRQEGWGSGEGQNRLHWKGKGQGAMSGNRWAASRETRDDKAPGYESWQNWHYGKDFHPYG